MKAISLWQPWATAMAVGVKRIETRHWPPPISTINTWIAIHATVKIPAEGMEFLKDHRTYAALAPHLLVGAAIDDADVGRRAVALYEHLPFGAIVAVGQLEDVVRTETLAGQISETERHFGNYNGGRYAWRFSEVRAITPVPCLGRQGIWNVPAELEAHVLGATR